MFDSVRVPKYSTDPADVLRGGRIIGFGETAICPACVGAAKRRNPLRWIGYFILILFSFQLLLVILRSLPLIDIG